MIYPVGKYDSPRFISTVTPSGYAVVDTKLSLRNGAKVDIVALHANGKANIAAIALAAAANGNHFTR